MAAAAGELEGTGAARVRQREIRTRIDQMAQGPLVARPAIAEDDRLDHRRPVQVVHVVQRRPGANELAHDFVVPEVRRRDERGAVVAAGHQSRVGAVREQEAQRFHVIGHRGDGDAIVAIVLQQVDVGARVGERLDRRALPGEDGDMERRAAAPIPCVEVHPGSGKPVHFCDVALRGGGVQALVRGDFRRARWDLSGRRRGDEEKRQREFEMKEHGVIVA
jgi:hypothetical protein